MYTKCAMRVVAHAFDSLLSMPSIRPIKTHINTPSMLRNGKTIKIIIIQKKNNILIYEHRKKKNAGFILYVNMPCRPQETLVWMLFFYSLSLLWNLDIRVK